MIFYNISEKSKLLELTSQRPGCQSLNARFTIDVLILIKSSLKHCQSAGYHCNVESPRGPVWEERFILASSWMSFIPGSLSSVAQSLRH